MAILPLSKKTKNEILEEYNKLLEQYEDLKLTSRALSDPQTTAILEKTKDYTVDRLTQSITDLRTAFNESLSQLSEKLLAEAKKLNELQQAIELSKKNLEINYHTQVAAETLALLISEHETKKSLFEEELKNRQRDVARAEEEYTYTIQLKRRREEESFQEEVAKKEKILADREAVIKAQEMEIQNFRNQAAEAPKVLERLLGLREQETVRRLHLDFDHERTVMKNEWDAQKNILELTIKNLEQQIKRQDVEISILKQETERANKKTQELAVKVIESRTAAPVKSEESEKSVL